MSSQGKKGLCKWRTSEVDAKMGAEAKATRKAASRVGGESGPNTEWGTGVGPEPTASLLTKPDGSPRLSRASEGSPDRTPNCSWEPLFASLPFTQQRLERQADARGLMA